MTIDFKLIVFLLIVGVIDISADSFNLIKGESLITVTSLNDNINPTIEENNNSFKH